MHGIVDEKTDVFAYGVLLLEIITGRKPIDSSKQSLLLWVRDTNHLHSKSSPLLFRSGTMIISTKLKTQKYSFTNCSKDRFKCIYGTFV